MRHRMFNAEYLCSIADMSMYDTEEYDDVRKLDLKFMDVDEMFTALNDVKKGLVYAACNSTYQDMCRIRVIRPTVCHENPLDDFVADTNTFFDYLRSLGFVVETYPAEFHFNYQHTGYWDMFEFERKFTVSFGQGVELT